MTLAHRNFGEFKVPGLRNVTRTAPYMHNGSLKTTGTSSATTRKSIPTACTPTASASWCR